MEEKVFFEKLADIKKRMQNNKSNPKKTAELMEELDQLFVANEENLKNHRISMRAHKELEDVYIIESEPFVDKQMGINYSNNMSGTEKVNYLTQKMRSFLANPEINKRGEKYDLSKDNLRGECIHTTQLLMEECAQKGIDIKGYNTKFDLNLVSATGNHAFAIATIDGKKYIIDCTYRQFFSVTNNINSAKNKDAGRYMLEDEQRREVAEHLLKYGWVEATPSNLKCYLDGFVMAERGSSDIETPTEEQYMQLLEEKHMEYKENDIVGKKGREAKISKKENVEQTESEYIIESEPYIDDNIDLEEYNENMSEEEKINQIVQRERARLSRMKSINGEPYDLATDNLRGDCGVSAHKVRRDCYGKGIKSVHMFTRSGLNVEKHLGHNFSIVKIGDKKYIVDCTYRQFFSKTYNNPTNDSDIHDAGMYMIANEERRAVAEQLLRYGWIEATPSNLKHYLDGFVMADRKSFEETGISCEEYINMFKEREEQEREEGEVEGISLSEIFDTIMESDVNGVEMENAEGRLLKDRQKLNEIEMCEAR